MMWAARAWLANQAHMSSDPTLLNDLRPLTSYYVPCGLVRATWSKASGGQAQGPSFLGVGCAESHRFPSAESGRLWLVVWGLRRLLRLQGGGGEHMLTLGPQPCPL